MTGRLIVSLAAAGILAGSVPAAADDRPVPAVYVTSADSGTITAFQIGDGGTLHRIGYPIDGGEDPRGIVVSPDGRTVYVSNNGADRLSVYRVGTDGGLSRIQYLKGGDDPFGLAVAPDGRALYVADIGLDTGVSRVMRFPIRADGTLGDGKAFPTGATHPRGVAVSPDGRFVFVSHGVPMPEAEPGVLTTLAVQSGGSLKQVHDPVRIGLSGVTIAIPPAAKFLYVGAQASGQVFGFRIGADGALTAVPRSPFDAPGIPEGITATADGTHVYVADEDETIGSVRGFSVAADGSLTEVGGSPFIPGNSQVGIAATPDSRFVYSSNGTDNNVAGFSVGDGGTLHPVDRSPFPTNGLGSAFQSVAVSPPAG
ncbi:MAG TPA: YncE family protein [Amycolatopsis sp.]|nr:YncE family protein [Amycolatopsis sp.]